MANYITASRILLIFPVLYLIADQNDNRNWIALALFITAGLTDHLDGYVARKTKTESALGDLLDLIANRLLICIPFNALFNLLALRNLFFLSGSSFLSTFLFLDFFLFDLNFFPFILASLLFLNWTLL